MILVRRTTNEIVRNVKRREYPNSNGYYFGASVQYEGTDETGRKVSITSKDRSKYVEGVYVGMEWREREATRQITDIEQLSKNTVLVSIEATLDSGKVISYSEEWDDTRLIEAVNA